MTLLPPSGFSDSRELIEAAEGNQQQLNGHAEGISASLSRLPIEALETMLAR